MHLAKAFARQPRPWILIEMVVALLVIGFFDSISGYEVRLLPFYCGPIFVVAWFCNKRAGLLIGLLAGIISLTSDWFDNDPDLRGWTRPWEITRHLSSCLAVAFVGSALRAKSDMAAARIALLERSQYLEREIVDISETEQRRIGQDLHDGLCQDLAALGCAATSLRNDLQRLDLGIEAVTAGHLAKLLQEAVVQTRDLAHELVPARVGQVGLVLALEALAGSVARLHGITCTFQSHGREPACDDRAAMHLYRIAQEAINNATRHGKAKNIAITLERASDLVTLRVLDDGVGMSEPNRSGMGFTIMRYRARLNGGELKVEQPSGGGTLVLCTMKANFQSSEIPAA